MNTSIRRDILEQLLTKLAGHYRGLARLCRIVRVAALQAQRLLDEIADEIEGTLAGEDAVIDEYEYDYDA